MLKHYSAGALQVYIILGSVMDKESTYGLKPEQLAELLSVGIGDAAADGKVSDDEAIAAALREQLECKLPTGLYLFDSLLLMLGRLGCDARSLVGKSLGEVLLAQETDVGLLQAIKDYCKKLSYNSVSDSNVAVATTIYYAALASGLLYHDKKLSQYSYKALSESFSMLAEKKWMTPELGRLFSRARDICENKKADK
jgi:hypothetical protein